MSLSTVRAALLRCLLALSLLGTGLGIVQAQERKTITGTTVSLVPLDGFTPSTTFAGLESASTKASLLVVELPPQAHDQLAPLFADREKAEANFARQNITVDDIESIETAAGTAPLLTGSQEANGTSYDKWIVLLKGEKTVMITVQSPDGADLDPDDIVAMLKTVSLGAPPSIADKLKALPFTVAKRERVPFAGSSGVLLTGTATDRGPEKRFAQYMATGADGRFVRLVAIAPAGAYDGVKAGIEKVAASIGFAAK